LPYSAFDQLQRVSHAAIIENKRLGEVLAWIKQQQDKTSVDREASSARRLIEAALAASRRPPINEDV
jgi:phage-related tail protein